MNMHSRALLVALVLTTLAWVAACGVHVALTKRPESADRLDAATTKRGCDHVQVLRGRAPHDWHVVAVVDLAAFSVRALPRDDHAFLELVRPAVCEAGGDAVIAGVNGDGRYVLGTVIAWNAADDAPENAPKESQADGEARRARAEAPPIGPADRHASDRPCLEGAAC